MGSRKQPNHGGSGLPFTRKSRPPKKTKIPTSYSPIETSSELEIYFSGVTLTCLICGGEYRSLGLHLSRSHSMGSSDYKEKFNIPAIYGLSGSDTKLKKSEAMKRNWEDNPNMEKTRSSLKRKDRVMPTGGVKKSTIKTEKMIAGREKAASSYATSVYKKYRPIYLGIINSAIKNNLTLYGQIEAHNISTKVSVIYRFAKRHNDDVYFCKQLAKVRQCGHAKPGKGLESRYCVQCGKAFTARVGRATKSCSRICDAKTRIKRIVKYCIICNKKMMLTPSDYKKLTTCGSKECMTARRSIKPNKETLK